MVMVVSPTGSYELLLPDDVLQQHEDGVTSFWRNGNACALQVSSYIRESGSQVSARERLTERIQESGARWRYPELKLRLEKEAELAAGEMTDDEGFRWLHVYIAWPDFAIYATVSWPEKEPSQNCQWAVNALLDLRRIRPAV
jgi:hypothetical protein